MAEKVVVRRIGITLLTALLATQLVASSNDASWISDIEYLTRELPRSHVNAFFSVSSASFEAAGKALVRDVPNLTDAEVVMRVYQLVAMIGDGHTRAYGWSVNSFPLAAYWFDDAIYITRASSENSDLLGCRLLAVDGRPIEEVTAAMSTLFAHENDQWMRSLVPGYLFVDEALRGLKITSKDRQATFTFMTAGGVRFERTLAAGGAVTAWVDAPLNPSSRNAGLNYWLEYWSDSGTVYLKYNRCQNDPARPFATYLNGFMTALGDKPIARVIIDLRDNSGGDSQVLQPAISAIQANPEYNRADRLFVVIGRRTFSSALMNAIDLDKQTNATLIGEPTGGKPNHYGEVRTMTLPWSRLTVSYSIRYWSLIAGADPLSLDPDILVRPTAASFFAGRDDVLDTFFPPRARHRPAGH